MPRVFIGHSVGTAVLGHNGDAAGSGNAGGTWDSGSNWSADPAGEVATVGWSDGEAAFFSAGGDGTGTWTATIDGTIATPAITFLQNGNQTIGGGTIDLGPSNGLLLDSSAAANSSNNIKTLNSRITGTGDLVINANGDLSTTGGGSNTRLILGNTSNDFTGDVVINSGLVSYASNASFGNSANKIILNGGGLLDANGSIALARDIEVLAGGGTFRTWGSVNTTWTGALTGSGPISRTDGGTLALDMDASGYTGTFTNERGTLRLLTNDWSGTDFVQTDGGNILRIEAAGTTTINSLTSDRDIVIGAGSRLNIAGGSYIANAGNDVNGFWMQGTSAGNDAATGALTSSSGTLTITNGAATGNLTTTDQRIRVFIEDHSAGNPLTLVKNNNNQLILDRTNTYSGGTVINGGRINADNVSAFGTGSVTVNSGGQAFLTQAGTYANDFLISGDGTTEAAGALGAIRFQNNATVSGNIAVAAGGARIAALGGQSGTHSGGLTGGDNLEINSAAAGNNGTITFTGDTSAYTGAMAVSQGRVNLNTAAFGGSVVVADGASFSGKSSIAGDLDLGSAAGANWLVNGGTPGAVAATNLNFNGAANAIIVEGAPIAPGPFTIATYSGALSGFGTLAVNNAASYRSVTLADTGGAITLDLGNGSRSWAGGDPTNPTFWDVNTTANWSGGDNLFFNGDTAVFDDTANSTTVAMQSLLSPAAVFFNNDTLDYTITGGAGTGLSGAMDLMKNGTGALTLGGVGSNFTGSVQVNAGVLNLANGEALGFNSGITIADGARLNLAGHAPSNQGRHYTWTIAGDGGDGPGGLGAITNSGGAVFADAGILNLILAGDAEIGGNGGRFDIGRSAGLFGTIAGNGFTLTKVGSNQVVARGQASNIRYTVNEGLLIFEDFDTASGTELITVNGGTLGTWGARTIANDVVFTGEGASLVSQSNNGRWTGTITLNGATTFDAAGTLVIDGALAGDGNITRASGGTLILQNTASAYSGKIINPSGTLRIGSNAALGTASGADVLTLGAGTTLQGGTLAGQASAVIGSATQGITQTGNVNYNPGAGNTLTINGAVTGSGNIDKINNNGTLEFNAPVSLNEGNLTGNGGALNINSGATLTTAASAAVLRSANGNVMNLSGTFDIRRLELATGTVNIGAGANITTNSLETTNGGSTISIINQTGGTVTVTGDNSTNSNQRTILMGHWGSGSSTYNLSAGEFNSPNAFIGLGWDSSAVFNQTGGTVNARGIGIGARNVASQYNLEGGRLNLGNLGVNGTASNKQINFGGGTLGASADWSSTQGVVFTGINGDTIVDTLDSVDGITARTIALNGAVSGAGGFSKINAGALVLGPADGTFTGTGRVSGGSLFIAGDAAKDASIIAESGGTLRAGTPTTSGSANVAALQLDTGSSSVFRIGGTGDRLNITGGNAFSTGGAGGHDISVVPAGQVFINDNFVLFDYEGTLGGGGFAGLTLNPLPNPHYTASLVDNSADTRVELRIDDINPVVWRGTLTNNWDVTGTQNWITENDNLPSLFYTFDIVKFDNASPSGTVELAGTIAPATVSFNSTNDHTLTGSGIGGAGGLTKDGTGTLTLLNSNTYTGTTNIQSGTVRVGNGSASGVLGGTGDITVATGATLAYDRPDGVTIGRRVVGGGALVQNGAGTLRTGQAGNNVDITINSGTFEAIDGGWATGYFASANRQIVVNDGGTLVTSSHGLGGLGGGFNRPDITINAGGTWQLNAEQYMDAGDLILNGGAILVTNNDLRLQGGTMNVGASTGGSEIAATGAGFVTLYASPTFEVANGAAAADLTISSPINESGTRGFTKTGDGTMVLSGTNTYSGITTVSGGTLQIDGANDGTGNVDVDSGATLGGNGAIAGAVNVTGVLAPGGSIGSLATGALSLLNGSALQFEANPLHADFADVVIITGDFNLSGTVTLGLSGADLASTAWALGDKLSIASYTGNWNDGTFDGFADNSVHSFGTNEWRILYADTAPGMNFSSEQSGSFVTLTVIPEPTTPLLALLGFAALMRRRRK